MTKWETGWRKLLLEVGVRIVLFGFFGWLFYFLLRKGFDLTNTMLIIGIVLGFFSLLTVLVILYEEKREKKA